MAVVLGLTLFFTLFTAGFLILLLKMIQKADPKKKDPSEGQTIHRAQDFLPIDAIGDGILRLSGGGYRAVLACTSTNYQLKTEQEREQIELSFQRFLNTITFPVSFYLETRKLDHRKRREELTKKLEETMADFPGLSRYGENYLYELKHLEREGVIYQKKRYVIVTLEGEKEESGGEEEEAIARKELQNRVQMIHNGLEAAGVHSYLLDKKGLTELLYAAYEREDASYAEAISDGEPLSFAVEGTNGLSALNPEEQLDGILRDSLTMLTGAGLDGLERARRARDFLEALREEGAKKK